MTKKSEKFQNSTS